jgi:hypothetical protein
MNNLKQVWHELRLKFVESEQLHLMSNKSYLGNKLSFQ